MTPLLVGTDGSHKMSKSLKNYIGVAEPPTEIFGKVMSIRDDLLLQYFELLTEVSDEAVAELGNSLSSGTVNPMELKKRLGRELITQLYSQKDAAEAEETFARIFQKKETPEELPEYHVALRDYAVMVIPPSSDTRESTFGFMTTSDIKSGIDISKLLTAIGLTKSRSEAVRLVAQGAVEIDGERISAVVTSLKSGAIIKVGKRRFARVIDQ